MISFRQQGRLSATGLILIAAVAAALGLWLGLRQLQAPALPSLDAAVLYPAPRALPDFRLTRSDGNALTLADWKGHWTVAFFGFTNCPDVCPTTLTTFKQVHKQLGDAGVADRVRFDFISVDPQRDTPELLARYVGYFSKDFVAATGPDEALLPLTRALGMVYARGEPKDGTYSVDHSASAVLVDPAGRQVGLFRPPFEAARMAADLEKLARTGGR
ncbi:SCO family protein [Dokdonella ginsengisoli]|uniref:SCO family protein n=1 Tax=Dokdonella ginsengisoli TaxID=363846 RepID=A0ABV9QUK0_9GAMM